MNYVHVKIIYITRIIGMFLVFLDASRIHQDILDFFIISVYLKRAPRLFELPNYGHKNDINFKDN